jgi:YfiH family protein
MVRRCVDGVVVYQFEALARQAAVGHAILARHGGVSVGSFATLNLGHTVGDDYRAVEENHRRGLAVIGAATLETVSPYQVHGARVAVVGRGHRGTVQPSCDGLVTTQRRVPLLLRFADCVPILLYDAVVPAVGLVHSGWQGTAANIAGQAVRVMVRQLGSRPADIWAGLGPAIGPCCYEVDAELARRVAAACPGAASITRSVGPRLLLDLPGAVRAQLQAAGVRDVEDSGVCTSCRVDEFFSHRAEAGRTGRFGVVVGLV